MNSKYQFLEMIEKSQTTEIFKAYYFPKSTTACVKIIKSDTIYRANKSFYEAQNLSFLKNFPKAIEFYESYIDKEAVDNKIAFVIIMEFCSQGNLLKHLESRSASKSYYSDQELISTIKEFVSLLKCLQ